MKSEINIRRAKKNDVSGILEIYSPFIKNSVTSFEREVPTEAGFWKRIEKVLEQSPWLVCEIDGKIAGYAYAGKHRSRWAYQWNREVSVYVHPDFRKRKIAETLYQIIIGIIKKQGFCNVIAGITMPNEASVALHKKFSFQLIGIYHQVGYKLGKWHDVSWWEMPLVEAEFKPKPIIALEEIWETDFCKELLKKGRETIFS